MSETTAMIIKVSMLALFFAVTIYIGIRFRHSAKNVSGFVLGGRAVGTWLTAFAYGTSYFSAVIFVGYAGQFGWRFGLAATWIGLGNAFIGSLLPWIILGRRTRVITHKLESKTMPDYFGKRFSSNALKIGASLIVFIFLIPYTASLYNGLSRLFNMAFGIDYIWCIILMSVLTCVYVILGGYVATAVNDFIQGIVMLVGIVAVIWAVLASHGGLAGAVAELSNVTAEGVNPGGFASFFGADPLSLLSVILLTSLGTWGLPQMIGKFYAVKDENAIRRGTLISTVFAIIIAGGCYFLGSFGRISGIETAANGNPVSGFDSIIPAMLENLGPVLIGLVVILVLSASISTLSSLVLTSSSTLTLDLINGNIVKKMKEKQQMLCLRSLIAVFILISAVIAILQYKFNFSYIAQLMGISWGALAGSFLAPYLFSLYWKRTTKAAVWASFGFSVTLMVTNMFFKNSFPVILQNSINCGAFAMIAGFVIVPVVSIFTKAPDRRFVDETLDSCNRPISEIEKEKISGKVS